MSQLGDGRRLAGIGASVGPFAEGAQDKLRQAQADAIGQWRKFQTSVTLSLSKRARAKDAGEGAGGP
jgi:hypothetical protein